MKRFFAAIGSVMLVGLALTACMHGTNLTVFGVIGGADGPTNIIVGAFGEQYEKKPVRMINIGGMLYYDTGIKASEEARCGTLDGELSKAAKEGQIPQNDGDANFDTNGYQLTSKITAEVQIDGKRVIFKQFENQPENLKDYKYCFYIKGKLNNAEKESEFIVLTNNKDVRFSDVVEPMFSSQAHKENEDNKISSNCFITDDKWGIELKTKNITNEKMTLVIEQFGKLGGETLETGTWFEIEKNVNGEWKRLDTDPLIDFAWTEQSYIINKNGLTELETNWKWLYGELSEGSYRLSKKITLVGEDGKRTTEVYSVMFEV